MNNRAKSKDEPARISRNFVGMNDIRCSQIGTTTFRVAAVAAIILIAAVLNGCALSLMEIDKSAGFNSGFEITKNGLPVNWYLYGPKIIKAGDVEISLDTEDAVEGKQSLKLLVHRVSGPGWHAAGLFQTIPAKAKQSYKVSFWLKNQGCKIGMRIRNEGTDPLFGHSEAEKKDLAAHPPIGKTLGEEETGINTWRQFEYIFVVPETDPTIRFELNVLEPGTLWIDDVRIEEVQTADQSTAESDAAAFLS